MAEFWMDEKGPYQDGYRGGYEDGRKSAKAEIESLRAELLDTKVLLDNCRVGAVYTDDELTRAKEQLASLNGKLDSQRGQTERAQSELSQALAKLRAYEEQEPAGFVRVYALEHLSNRTNHTVIDGYPQADSDIPLFTNKIEEPK